MADMQQKCFNAYEETMRVPLVYSNPRLWSKPQTCDCDGLARRPPAHDGEPRRCTGSRRAPIGRASTTRITFSSAWRQPRRITLSSPTMTTKSGSCSPPYVKAAAAHRQPEGAALEDRRVRRRQRQGPQPVGDVRPQARTRSSAANLAHKGYKRTSGAGKAVPGASQRKLARVKKDRLHPLPDTPQPQTTGNPQRTSPISSMD